SQIYVLTWSRRQPQHLNMPDSNNVTSEPVRLVNGNNSCSGRLEVFYNDQWGTVCDDGWDLSDAAVVCREMGCGDAIEAKSGAYFRPGGGQVSMSDIGCVENEPTLSSCSSKKAGEFYCDHSKDAGIVCRSLVRLVNGSHSCSGRVEVFNGGQWGTVCDNGWDYSDAAVICKEMGCGNVFEQRIGGFFGQGLGPVWLSDVQCYNSETNLRRCNFQGWGQNLCGHEKDATVACKRDICGMQLITTENYFSFFTIFFLRFHDTKQANIIHRQQLSLCRYSGRINLENGFNACSGRVEIFNRWGNTNWGTVCGDGWDLSEAAVVCREMGCGDAIAAKGAAYFGQGPHWYPVWLDDINCIGNELTLAACESKQIEDFQLHYKDAGVICQCKLLYCHSCKNTEKKILSVNSSSLKNEKLLSSFNPRLLQVHYYVYDDIALNLWGKIE
uniref:Soluble scavenger receptor cysteine-rich domain-containing protein SSC5D n=1 Tax=Sinocyclocheilus rhinocerous TaxID=307959 RepID=A0A673IDG6_9TELE